MYKQPATVHSEASQVEVGNDRLHVTDGLKKLLQVLCYTNVVVTGINEMPTAGISGK